MYSKTSFSSCVNDSKKDYSSTIFIIMCFLWLFIIYIGILVWGKNLYKLWDYILNLLTIGYENLLGRETLINVYNIAINGCLSLGGLRVIVS